MRAGRTFAITGLALAISGAAPAAQVYSVTGKFARSNGAFIDIPLVGNNPGNVPNCGYTKPMGTKVAGVTPIHQGVRVSLMMTGLATPASPPQRYANPHGCVSAVAAAMLKATAPGAGAAFTIPTKVWSRPLPGMAVAVSFPLAPNIAQFQTSLALTGPPAVLGTAPNGTMNDGMNTAMFRFFHKDAWLSQTGRAGAMFTWCFGNPGCAQGAMGTFMGIPAGGVNGTGQPSAAYPVHEVFVKYTPGANRFGGTMSHVLAAGPNPSGAWMTAGGVALFLNQAAGSGSQPTGRGYADFLTHAIMGGPAWAMFMVGPVYVPQRMQTQSLITTVMTMVPGSGSSATVTHNKNFGFPWTTGTVLARNTGTDIQGNPVVVTLTGKGKDYVTGMGGRNIQLVAGAVTAVDYLFASESPGLNQMFLKLPEPQGPAAWLAGAVALGVLAAWRSRRSRAA